MAKRKRKTSTLLPNPPDPKRPARAGAPALPFIDGVHNYCDRWCERCPLATRCRSYALEQEFFPNREARDSQNHAFWQGLKRVFEKTKRLLTELSRERGAELIRVDLQAVARRRRRQTERLEGSELARESETYVKLARQWFARQEPWLAAQQAAAPDLLEMQPARGPASTAPLTLHDALDVVRWYQFLIVVRLNRAIGRGGAADLPSQPSALAHAWAARETHDANGSAKIALLGVDRSIAAWTVIRDAVADDRDSILDILLHLDRLRRHTERQFPHARAFLRPGFDTGELAAAP